MGDKPTMQRLTFIKYLYGVAVEQSRQPEPLGAASILTLHDSVELFLQLASEYRDAKTTAKMNFMDYWDVLNDKLPNAGLAHKESMSRLNKARVSLKHHGTFPSATAIESLRSSVTNFFEDNTPIVFNIDFGSISMINLVVHEVAREKLTKAQRLMDESNAPGALAEIAEAFEHMLKDYRSSTGMGFKELRSLAFYRIPRMRTQRRRALGEMKTEMRDIKSKTLRGVLGPALELLTDLYKSVTDTQRAMNIMVLGLDYRRYAKFEEVTPRVTIMADNQIMANNQNRTSSNWVPPEREDTVTLEDVPSA
jgi:hypothetical protein